MVRPESIPEICERCAGTVFNHQVCVICGWRPVCPGCGCLVSGRADKVFCSERCKKARWDRERGPVTGPSGARRVVVEMSDPQFRDWIRGVMVKREAARAELLGQEPPRRGRLRVRWGRS